MSSLAARVRLAPATVRRMLGTVAVAGGALFYLQVVLPGTGGGRGTPGAVLFTGLVFGLINALTAAAIVLVYRTVRIINFAQTAIGAAGAELGFRLLQQTAVPFAVAFGAGLVLAGLLGLAFDLIFGRRFFHASRLVLTVVTIAVAGLSVITTAAVTRLPFFSEPTSIGEAFGTLDIRRLLPFAGFHFEVGDFPIPFGFSELFAIEASIVALVLVGAFLRFTRVGVGVRAMAENPERAGLLGISVGTMSSVVWIIAGLLGGLSVFLFGSVETPAAARGVAPGVLVPALAAATLARFRSIPVAAGAAVLIGILVRGTLHSYGDHLALVNVAVLAVIVLGLLSHARGAGRSEQGATTSWQAVDEQRPVPEELAALPTVRIARRVIIVIALAAVLVYPYLVDIAEIRLGGTVALLTVTAISVVLLTGWAGQVSLGQWAIAGIGAVVAGSLTSRAGVPFWLAAPMAAAIAAGAAVAIGLTALRIRGLFLAVTTLAFAFAVHSALFDERYFGWLLPEGIERPTLFFLDFADERSMYYLTIATLVLALVAVSNLRRSRFGRILVASRDNEQNLAAFGVSVVRARLLAFAVAGTLAGLAGAVFAHQQLGTTADAFAAQRSIDVFLMTVIGGIGSMGGALLGSLFWNGSEHFWPTNQIVQFLRPFSVLIVLYAAPAGVVSLFTRLRDEALRIIAQRRQIAVPSLFADYDPEALERRLIPLATGSDDAGLGALPLDERYTLASELYGGSAETGRGELVGRGDGNGERRPSEPALTKAPPETVARVGDIETGPPTVRELLRESYNWRALVVSPYGLTPVLLVSLVFFFVGLNQQVPSLAVLDIVRDLGFTLDGVIRFLNFIGIVTLLIALGPGYWADRHKRIWLLGGGLVAVGFVGPLAALAGSPLTLGIPLVATGFLLVVANIPTVSLIPDWYPVPAWGKAFALLGLFQAVGGAIAFYTAGELIDAYGWRTTYVALFAPVMLGGFYALWRLREPIRGYFERIHTGASEEIARDEDEAPSFGEAWRTIWGIRVFRRIFISDLFTTAGLSVFGLMLFFLLVQEYRFTPADLGRLSATTAILGGVPGAFLGGGLIDAFARRRPAQLLTLFGVFSLVAAFPTLVYPSRPPVWVFYVVGMFIGFGLSLLGPTLGALYAWILPSHVRTLGGVMRGLAALPGALFVVPIAAIIAQEYGIASALFIPFPLFLIGSVVFITAAPLYELDSRAKMAREFAWHEWREAKEAGRTKLLVCREVSVDYDGVQVLFGVDFGVDEGEIVAILGTNGAGKSTLLRAISGSHPASSGGISLDGRDITFMPSHEVARRGVIHVPGGRGVFPDLTVRENLLLGTWMIDDDVETTRRLGEILEVFPDLAERGDDPAGDLSGGQQQMLSLAQAFLCNPRLLLIDELSLGLAPAVVADLLEVVRRINERGVTVIVVEQSVNVALNLARRAVFMEKGEVKFSGPTDELLRRPDILRSVYVKGTAGIGTGVRGRGAGDGRGRKRPEEARAVLEADAVVKTYGGVVALAGLDMTLRDGEILGMIGPNGSGKTTLLEVMSGFVTPDSGRVHYDGVDITELPPHVRMQQGLVRRFQDARLFPSLTVFETLLVALDHQLEVKNTVLGALAMPQARRSERRARVRADALVELLELGAYRDKFVRELSTGVRRITDLACVIAADPKVLLLDEPSTGIAQAEAELLAPLLRRIRHETGCSILIVEHDIPLVSSVADSLVALDQGAVVIRDTPELVLSDDRVIESYLGASQASLRRSGSAVS